MPFYISNRLLNEKARKIRFTQEKLYVCDGNEGNFGKKEKYLRVGMTIGTIQQALKLFTVNYQPTTDN